MLQIKGLKRDFFLQERKTPIPHFATSIRQGYLAHIHSKIWKKNLNGKPDSYVFPFGTLHKYVNYRVQNGYYFAGKGKHPVPHFATSIRQGYLAHIHSKIGKKNLNGKPAS